MCVCVVQMNVHGPPPTPTSPNQVGKSLRRGVSRHKSAPRKPKDGWSLVVRPLTPGQGDGYGEAYVAQPDGSRRQLTEDEQYYLYRQRPRKRRRRVIMPTGS